MTKVMLRIWLVGTILWLVRNLYIHRSELSGFNDRDWNAALTYGVKNFICDLGVSASCPSAVGAFWQKGQLNETFGLILTFVGVPVAFFFACLTVAWIFHGIGATARTARV